MQGSYDTLEHVAQLKVGSIPATLPPYMSTPEQRAAQMYPRFDELSPRLARYNELPALDEVKKVWTVANNTNDLASARHAVELWKALRARVIAGTEIDFSSRKLALSMLGTHEFALSNTVRRIEGTNLWMGIPADR